MMVATSISSPAQTFSQHAPLCWPLHFLLPRAPRIRRADTHRSCRIRAGGSIDTAGRAVAQKLADTFGQQIVIDNRTGSGGTSAPKRRARRAGRLHARDRRHGHACIESAFARNCRTIRCATSRPLRCSSRVRTLCRASFSCGSECEGTCRAGESEVRDKSITRPAATAARLTSRLKCSIPPPA